MKNYQKYQKQYFMPPVDCFDWVKKEQVEKAPIWCSVDLRDGNQALIEPMGLEEKLKFFELLVEVGFKEIEVGFPAASETEYTFLRTLIERNMIPDDVTIQVLTQSREHIIKKTFEAVKGAPRAVIHLYNSTSLAQREQVFKKSKEEILEIATSGARLLKKLADETEGNFLFEYSPESSTGTEMEYALEVVNGVIDIWEPAPDKKVIINLPATVEHSLPHVFASQVEYMSKNMHNRENVILSLHPHNDRGCGVSDAELGILAGADRIEGTLFGNGERTGNVDIITLALNMFAQGIDPELDFSDMPHICECYKEYTGMEISMRQPYAGELVFAAFSGSHQDAIAKGMQYREDNKCDKWTVPYLPIDPKDVGREYDSDVIRINSQSGKGGVGYILNRNYGINLPKAMKEQMGYLAKGVSDRGHKELHPEEIYKIFAYKYMNFHPYFTISESHFAQEDGIKTEVTIVQNAKKTLIRGEGNGRLDAVSNALKKEFDISYEIFCYEEHSMGKDSSSNAMAYVGIKNSDNECYWGCGSAQDIITASINALVIAINNKLDAEKKSTK